MPRFRVCILPLTALLLCASPAWGQTPKPRSRPASRPDVRHKRKSVKEWTAQLADKDQDKAIEALEMLALYKNAAEPALPKIVALLGEERVILRERAHEALEALGAISVAPLTKALSHKDVQFRWWAVLTLRNLGKAARPAVPKLIELLKDKDSSLRSMSALALGQIGGPSKTLVPALLARLDDKARDVCANAAQALAQLGPTAKSAVPELAKRLGEAKEARRRKLLAECLGRFGPSAAAAAPTLVERLKNDKDWLVRASSAEALGKIGVRSKDVMAALKDALKDKRDAVKYSAEDALNSLTKK